jgi:hypothetical protein
LRTDFSLFGERLREAYQARNATESKVCKFRGGLPVAFDKKERWPEHYDSYASCDLIVYPLRSLHARHLRSPARDPRGFGGELLAAVALVLKRRDICSRERASDFMCN